MSNIVLNEEDKKKFEKAVNEISNAMLRMSAERELINDIIGFYSIN